VTGQFHFNVLLSQIHIVTTKENKHSADVQYIINKACLFQMPIADTSCD